MPNPAIANIDCPACDDKHAEVRESGKNKRAYVVCDECGYQAFTRGDKSNEAIRKKSRPLAAKPASGAEPKPGAGAGGKRNFWNDDFLGVGGSK